MRDQLSLAEQCAIDAAGAIPPRVKDVESNTVCVLLPSNDFDSIRALLQDQPDVVRLRDPRTDRQYALVPLDRYERFKAIFEYASPQHSHLKAEQTGTIPETGKYPPELLEWAMRDFDEVAFAESIREIQGTGGVKLEDFIQELEQIVATHE